MQRAEKFYLVSESRLRQLEHASTKSDIISSIKQPVEQQLVKVYRRMDNVLNDPTKSDHEKTVEHGEALDEFTVLRDRLDHRKNIIKPDTNVDAPEQLKDALVESTLANMPKTVREPAQHLMNLLSRKSSPLTWSPNGDVYIENKKLHGAHIADLVSDVLRQRKIPNPDRQRFLEVLAGMNAPNYLVKNLDAQKMYKKIKRRSHPPGIPADSSDNEDVFESVSSPKKRKSQTGWSPAKKTQWTIF